MHTDYKREIIFKMTDSMMKNPITSAAQKLNVENAMLAMEVINKVYACYIPDALFPEKKRLNEKLRAIKEILQDDALEAAANESKTPLVGEG